MQFNTVVTLSALLTIFCIGTLALREDVKARIDCARKDCAAHQKLWKNSQNATLFRNYLKCLDDCIEEKLHLKGQEQQQLLAPSRHSQ
ncbi:hypothetical protein M514_07349 [Trichuris suis]|uniref:Uncharacterized protein n=1 Tax=Trichuris suis TaxID=68888 RepID=A0A085M3M6_9BILA|nr:hypothetical protein M513_07349 [Trichuris suis]KFD68365.1 hypothetical protein M514_07349 [Trichuris suis]